MTGIDWRPAIAILAGGVILGAMIVFYLRSRKTKALAVTNDLEAERDALLAQLRALDADAVEERARLERETADVLRKLDVGRASARPEARPVEKGGLKPALQGFLWGVGSFAALALMTWFVMRTAKPRAEGESPVGGGPMQQELPQQPPQPPDAQLRTIEARVKNAPNDVDARIDLAKAYLERDNLMAVYEHTQFVLTKNPGEPRALTYQAFVRLAMGDVESAKQMLQIATNNDPTLLDGWVTLAWVHVQSGDMQSAEKAIASAKKARPNEAQRIDGVFAQMKMQIAQQQQQLPADHPPVQSGGGESVRVSLALDPSAQAKNGVVYVIIRAAGVQAGPPVAVKRVMAAQLPMTVDVSKADSMMGQPLPQKMRVEARLDTDGDAATRNPNDPSAAQDGIALGAAVALTLK